MVETVSRRNSITRRLSLIVGGALVAAVLVVGGLALLEQRRQLTRALETKAASLAQFMAQVSPISILSLNFVEMNNNVRKVVLTDDEAVYALIVNEKGIPLAYYLKDADPAVSDETRALWAARSPLAAIEAMRQSARILAVEAPIKAGEKLIGSATVGFSFDRMHRALMVQIALIGAILVVVTGASLLVLVLALRRILQPVQALTSAATQISTGDLNVALTGTDRSDELGVLSRAFESMAAQLRGLIAGMAERMAELQRMGQALRKSEEEFRRIVATASEGIVVIDLGGRITFVNARMAEMFCRSAAEMAGRSMTDFMFDEDVPDHKKKMENRSRGLSENYERRYRRSDGQVVWTHVSATPITDDSGQYAGSFGMFTDITERKRAEEEVHKLNQELEQRVAERTAQLEAANKELEAFAYSVSHDLRAPLRHIDGFVGLLKKKSAATADEQSRHYMDTISDAARRMGTLIDDLLSFSRMGRAEMTRTEIDLGELVQEVIQEFEPETKGRAVDWRAGALPVINGDRAMLRMVLVNLISNALKFTQPRERAQIEVGCLPEQATETVVFVRDNGVGFDMQYAGKLFGVFQRLHGVEEFEGTGIGLANVRRVIGRHGGRTWAEGKVDGGATFYFSLPQASLKGESPHGHSSSAD